MFHPKQLIFSCFSFLVLLTLFGTTFATVLPDTLSVPVFRDATIHFQPDSAGKYATEGLTALDNGRILATKITLPEYDSTVRIFARVVIKPIPKDERSVFDHWDRAGSIRLAQSGEPDIEIMRFMTSYGGRTEHDLEVTPLAPLLRGDKTLKAFVDTWVTPGWKIDFTLTYIKTTDFDNPSWVDPVYFCDSFNKQDMPNGVEVETNVPAGLARVAMVYYTTGHCTDGTDEDEFVSKANVISIDGTVAERMHPWRDDCRKNREVNPYTARWSDGTWSSDLSRSGWCPGSLVYPNEFDFTDHLTPGKHKIKFVIENMRPKNEKGDFGYWRVSAFLVGWKKAPNLWQNR